MTDHELIEGIKKESNAGECLMELVSRHSGIYMAMVNNYTPPLNSIHKSHKNELINDKNYYIYQAAMKYDKSKKTKFSTYLGNETRWMCLNLFNKEKRRKFTALDFTKPQINDIPNEENHAKDQSNRDFLDQIIKLIERDPDSRISKIFKKRYFEGDSNKVTPWKKIGEDLQLSIQGCINIHDKAIIKIKKELNEDIWLINL